MSASELVTPQSGRMMPTFLTVFRWEARKLLALKRTYVGLAVALLLPAIFTAVVSLQGPSAGPRDLRLAGPNLHHTGLVVTLVMLFFTAAFAGPLVIALVPGDIVGSEDSDGTLKMLLTRSCSRGQVLVGKMLAAALYVLAVLLMLALSGVLSGVVAWGFHPLLGLSGQSVGAGKALALNFAATGVYALPMLAVAAFAFMLSTLTRNGAASIVITVVYVLIQEAVHGLVHGHWVFYLLSVRLDAWQGLFYSPTHWGDVYRAAWISAIYAAVPLLVAYLFFQRRDVASDG